MAALVAPVALLAPVQDTICRCAGLFVHLGSETAPNGRPSYSVQQQTIMGLAHNQHRHHLGGWVDGWWVG